MNTSLRCFFSLSFFMIGFYLSVARAEFKVPPLQAPITDLTSTLSPAFKQRVDSALRELQSRTTTQMAVLIVPDLGGVPIEMAAIEVVEKWKLGKADTDRGLLLMIAMKERRMRIEVGQGLEGEIPDAMAKRVIADVITPRFKNGDIEAGVLLGLNELVSRAEPSFDFQSYFGGEGRRGLGKPKKSSSGGLGLIILCIIIIVIFRLLGGGRGGGSGFYGGTGYGGGFGGGFGGGSSGGGFSGGGGGFSGGGASGSW